MLKSYDPFSPKGGGPLWKKQRMETFFVKKIGVLKRIINVNYKKRKLYSTIFSLLYTVASQKLERRIEEFLLRYRDFWISALPQIYLKIITTTIVDLCS